MISITILAVFFNQAFLMLGIFYKIPAPRVVIWVIGDILIMHPEFLNF